MRRDWGASINVAGDAKKSDVDILETKLKDTIKELFENIKEDWKNMNDEDTIDDFPLAGLY